MAGHTCYHCKHWVDEGEPHDCWTTTEAALTRDLSEDLGDAYDRLRDTVVEFGEQRIYASHKSIMFSRASCYFFVRPKKKALEVVVFLGRAIKAPQIRKVVEASRVKRAHVLHLTHRDEVEAPITDWLREAYDFAEAARRRPAPVTHKPAAAKSVARRLAKTSPRKVASKPAKGPVKKAGAKAGKSARRGRRY